MNSMNMELPNEDNILENGLPKEPEGNTEFPTEDNLEENTEVSIEDNQFTEPDEGDNDTQRESGDEDGDKILAELIGVDEDGEDLGVPDNIRSYLSELGPELTYAVISELPEVTREVLKKSIINGNLAEVVRIVQTGEGSGPFLYNPPPVYEYNGETYLLDEPQRPLEREEDYQRRKDHCDLIQQEVERKENELQKRIANQILRHGNDAEKETFELITSIQPEANTDVRSEEFQRKFPQS